MVEARRPAGPRAGRPSTSWAIVGMGLAELGWIRLGRQANFGLGRACR
jgi:hypothetical protein